MLVLTRDHKENSNTILIGDDIEITILSPGQVKIGIDAPKQVPIVRGELELKPVHSSRETKSRPNPR